MNYVEVVNLIFTILFALFGLYLFPYLLFSLIGLFHTKRYPKTKEEPRYGIIVPAKNEENVISNFIESIKGANYPKDKIDIFVVVHNCSDKTAEVSRRYNVKVYEYDDPNANTMGGAFKYLFEQINKDYDIMSYDGFFIFNADNTVEKEFFHKMSDAFIFYKKEAIITSYRQASNLHENVVSMCYGYYFAMCCGLAFLGRTNAHVSSRITGCGYVIPSFMIKDGWKYTSLTEDIELTADTAFNGHKIMYCDDAEFYDEQPTSWKVMWKQRLRWAKGIQIVAFKYFGKLLKALFKSDTKDRFKVYDILTFSSLPFIMMTFLTLLRVIALLFSPLGGVSLQDAFLYYDPSQFFFINMYSFKLGFVYSFARSIVQAYLLALLVSISLFIKYHKRFKGPFFQQIITLFTYPIFVYLQLPLDLVAFFKKEVKWAPIPHKG